MRILVGTPLFLPVVGGAEIGIHEIYKRLGDEHDVTIVTPRLPIDRIRAASSSDYGAGTYDVLRFGMSPGQPGAEIVNKLVRRNALSPLHAVRRTAGVFEPDVANLHLVRSHGLVLAYLRRALGIPVMLSLVARSDVVGLLPQVRKMVAARIVREADVVAPISAFYLDNIDRARRIETIPYGVDTSEFTPAARRPDVRGRFGINASSLMLVAVQRLVSVKRVDTLIAVMSELVHRGEDVHLVVVGDGEERSNLQRQVTGLGLDQRVHLAGYVSSAELPMYFASADLFVFHSLFETFGIVFAQAMASGLPIVAANTSCVPSVVHADNGTLVVPFDTSGFADTVQHYARHPEERVAIGAKNRRRALREFDWGSIAAAYERTLLSLLSR